jgi:hypothetical protein
MFTEKELADIEAYRANGSPGKAECHWMLKYMNRLLPKDKQEPRQCFCTKIDRQTFHTRFFAFWDQNKTK